MQWRIQGLFRMNSTDALDEERSPESTARVPFVHVDECMFLS